jgi:O-antigen ligase
MPNLEKFRLPYRDDPAFGFLALGVFLLPLAFSQYSYENFESIKFSLFLLCVGASAVVFFWRQKSRRLRLKSPKYFYWLLGGFGFWAVLASFFARDYLYAFFGFYYRYTSGLVFYAAFLAFVFLLLNLADEQKIKFIFKIIVFDGLVVALEAFLDAFGLIIYQGLNSDGFFRGPGLLGNIDFTAIFLACVLPIAAYFLITSRTFKGKIYYAVSIFLMILSGMILASRGGLLAMAASVITALLLLAVYKFPKKFFWILLLSALIAGAGGNLLIQASRPGAITSIVTAADNNTFSRLYAWRVSLEGIEQSPLVGFGPGNYALFFEQNRLSDPSRQIGVFDDAHNLFLDLAVTGGIPQLLLFLGLILLAGFYGIKQLSKDKSLLTVAIFGSLAAWLVGASFNPVPIPMFMLLALLLVALLLPSVSVLEINFAGWKRILFLALAWLMLLWGAANFISEPLLGFGARAYGGQDYKQAYKLDSLSFALNPTNVQSLNFKTAGEIGLGFNKGIIDRDIGKIESMHKSQAASYVLASNLYALRYSFTKNSSDLQAAISAMQSALKIDPLFAQRYGQLAIYYYEAGDFKNSRTAIEQDLGLQNQDVSGWVLLAKLYQINNNRAGLIFALTKAFKLNPDGQMEYLLNRAKKSPDVRLVPLEIYARAPNI